MSDPARLADLVLVVHALVVLFVVGGQALVLLGGALHWGWVRNLAFRAIHLSVLVVVVVQTWLGQVCPLTTWEWDLRRAAGETAPVDSFIGHWLRRLIFYEAPEWAFTLTYSVFAILVLASWWWFPPRWRR